MRLCVGVGREEKEIQILDFHSFYGFLFFGDVKFYNKKKIRDFLMYKI